MELFNLISLCLQVTFDDFEMVKVLGCGMFGKVVVALEKAAQKVVAIKILKKDVIIAKVSVSVCWFEVRISVCSEVSRVSKHHTRAHARVRAHTHTHTHTHTHACTHTCLP